MRNCGDLCVNSPIYEFLRAVMRKLEDLCVSGVIYADL